MIQIKQFCLPLFIIFISTDILMAQKEIPLWETSIPGEIKSDAVKEYSTGEIESENLLRIHQVINPTIRTYLAPKDKANGAAVLICPGGGYKILAIDHEGYQIAEWLNNLGISAFVLKYRLPDERIMKDQSIGPLQDAQRAIRLIRNNAQKWKINPRKIGVMGFSAGGHLAASLSTHYDTKIYEDQSGLSARPDFSILIYPVISLQEHLTHGGSKLNLLGNSPQKEEVDFFSNELHIDTNTPPTLLIHSLDDKAVSVDNSMTYFKELKKNKINSELHIFSDGGHGYGMGKSGSHSLWTKNAEYWFTQILKNNK